METTLTKFEKAVINAIDKAANVFITVMAVIFALVGIAVICTGLDFVNLWGFAAFMAAAWFLWSARR